MRYDGLEASYWALQDERIKRLVARIQAGESTGTGRVVPELDDLVIGEGRQLGVAVLFLDISGFSALPSETIQEQDLLVRCLSLFFSEAVRIAEDYGGVVEKNTGDGMMAYFAEDTSLRANASERAVAAALTIESANSNLIAPYFRASGCEPFRFRVGIDQGYVTIARLGAPRRFNAIAAVGATANFACKLLALGSAGDVLLGDGAKRQLSLAWQLSWCDPLGLPTGWHYRLTGLEYGAWRFTGRWAKLV